MFILDHIDRELYSLERLELKFDSSLEFFDKIPVRILLDVLFRVFRFSNASLYVLAYLKLRHHLDTETYGRLPWQFCNFTCEITNYKQLLDEVFVISGIIKVEVSVISRSRRLRLITLTEKRIEKPFLLRCPRT